MTMFKSNEGATRIVALDLVCDTRAHLIRKRNRVLFLTPTEYNMLLYLMKRPGEFVLFEELYEEIWQQPSLGNLKSMFVHMKNLRKKLEDDPSNPTYIITRERRGYVFAAEELQEKEEEEAKEEQQNSEKK